MKSQPIVVIPSPKHESLEVQHQEITVQEWANDLTEACLKVDHDVVHTMHDLTNAMGHASVGGLAGSGTGGWAAGVSMGVGWSGECEGGASKGKGRGRSKLRQRGREEMQRGQAMAEVGVMMVDLMIGLAEEVMGAMGVVVAMMMMRMLL